jgi:hypothetical protein
MRTITRSDLALLAYTKHRGLLVSRIRKAIPGLHHADLEDIVADVLDILLTLDNAPDDGDEMRVINHAITEAIARWRFATERNGVPTDPSDLDGTT